MIELGAAPSDEMALCFLRAEIDSHRHAQYMQAIHVYGLDLTTLIDDADLSDPHANRSRATLLGEIRGYGRGALVFSGFPSDVTWRRVSIPPAEFGRLKYLSVESWIKLSGGSRL